MNETRVERRQDPESHLDPHLESTWWALRIALGLGPLLAGIDKFFNILTHWAGYLSPQIAQMLPMSPEVFMRIVGVIEIIVGLAILTNWTRIGAYVAAIWLLAIAANLLMAGRFYDIAVRDVLIAFGEFALARLTEARVGAHALSNAPHWRGWRHRHAEAV